MNNIKQGTQITIIHYHFNGDVMAETPVKAEFVRYLEYPDQYGNKVCVAKKDDKEFIISTTAIEEY